MLLALWTVILTCAAIVGWDWWASRPQPATRSPYDWARDAPLARLLADQEQADGAWDHYFDQHGILVFPTTRRESS